MKKVVAALVLALTVAPAFAQKPCEELKSEIAAKLEAKGVKNYQLEVVAAEEIKDQTVIGSCESGRKKIIYKKKTPGRTGRPDTSSAAPSSSSAARPWNEAGKPEVDGNAT